MLLSQLNGLLRSTWNFCSWRDKQMFIQLASYMRSWKLIQCLIHYYISNHPATTETTYNETTYNENIFLMLLHRMPFLHIEYVYPPFSLTRVLFGWIWLTWLLFYTVQLTSACGFTEKNLKLRLSLQSFFPLFQEIKTCKQGQSCLSICDTKKMRSVYRWFYA